MNKNNSHLRKKKILALIIEVLRKEERLLIDANLAAKEAATEAEAKPENKYDTRALEQSYLAAGQAKRAEALKIGILNLQSLSLQTFEESDVIDISAIVHLESEEEGDQSVYFLLPNHGGIKVQYEGAEIFTLSPDSPLGQKLVGKAVGDFIETKVAGKIRSYRIVSIS